MGYGMVIDMSDDKIFLIIFTGLNGLMWVSVIDWMIKTDRNNKKLNLLLQEYCSKTYEDTMHFLSETSNIFSKFLKFLEEDYAEIQGKKNNR